MNSGIEKLKNSLGQKLYHKAKNIIPGGTQLLSKRPEMFAPNIWPSYYSYAKGCEVWDMENNKYIDMSIMGIGSNILGYADSDVDLAVTEAIKHGVSSSLNCYEEVELAELLVEIHPWSEMVRFTRSGGEACSVAVRIARAFTNREKVMFSGYHGWADWYLAANLGDNDALDGQLMPGLDPAGIPRGLKDSAIPFHFNNIDELKNKAKGFEKEIAAIIVEPARGEDAPKNYLIALKEYAEKIGAVLIFDEITSGFRMCNGGIHLNYGINPDLAVFAKSMANGYAMAAIIGCEKVMSSAQSSFISSTNWTERIGPVASIATIKKFMTYNVSEHIITIGNAVKGVWDRAAKKNGLKINITGLPSLAAFSFENKYNQELMTFFTIEMLLKGFLGFRQFKPSFAHKMKDVEKYEVAVNEVFKKINYTPIDQLLDSPVAHIGLHRLTKE